MGSWPFLIYMIDVLTTDGAYGGWVALLLFSTVVYSILWFLKTDSSTSPFFLGQNLTLNQDWAKFKAGDVLIVEELHETGLVKVKYPNGVSSGWLKVNAMQRVSANKCDVKDEKPTTPVDITRGPRKISGFFMIICIIGILYANFMPQKETAYKMLAAYVGQNVVESPRTQQLADSTIKYLDAQIKKYTDELDAAAKATEAEKAKETK